MKVKHIGAGLLGCTLAMTSSYTLASDLRIDGFASFIAGQVLDKDEIGPDGNYLGFDDRADFQTNSIYGIQFRADLGKGLTATGQVVGQGSDDFDAKITWAYLTYEFNPE